MCTGWTSVTCSALRLEMACGPGIHSHTHTHKKQENGTDSQEKTHWLDLIAG